MKIILLYIIKLYQKYLSYDYGFLGKVFPNTRYCRFTPTCSMYAYNAVEKYGLLKGGYMSLKRVRRCNRRTPMGTYDPVS